LGDPATIENGAVPTISGLNAKFTKPGDSVSYVFYVRNEGGYKAYLNSISFGGKKCTPAEGTSFEMVNNACNAITTTVSVGNIQTSETKTNITGETLEINQSKQVTVTITYETNGALADGPFTVEFGDISMYYATISGMNEEIQKICQLTNDKDGDGIASVGDEVACGNESFYVIPNDPTAHPTAIGDNITLLAKYNLNVGNDAPAGTKGIQNEGATGSYWDEEGIPDRTMCNFTEEDVDNFYNPNWNDEEEWDLNFYKAGYGCNGTMPFSETKYWGEEDEGAFIYNNQSLLYPHVENYKTYMRNLGVDVKEASLASINQVGDKSSGELIVDINLTSFWLGTTDGEGVDAVNTNIFDTNEHLTNWIFYVSPENGVRPIIVVPQSEIE
jgi:hypothetical protein